MSEHYSGNDPGTGCALMILGVLAILALIGLVAIIRILM